MKYNISKFEQQGDNLSICITSLNNPVWIKHTFTEDEKLDTEGTIEKLIGELALLDESYIAPPPLIDRLDEVKGIVVTESKISTLKNSILEERAFKVAQIEAGIQAENQKLEEERLALEKQLEDEKLEEYIVEPVLDEIL